MKFQFVSRKAFLSTLITLTAMLTHCNANASFPNMDKELKKGNYKVMFLCKVKSFFLEPYFSLKEGRKYPELVGRPVYVMESTKWFITKIVIGELANPDWVSRRLYNQSGIYNNDSNNYSFSYASIGGGYHGLVSIDKKSGNGLYKLRYDDIFRFIDEPMSSLTKLELEKCQ